MDKIRKALLMVLAATALLILGYLMLRGVASWNKGYSWKEMDWQQRGSTSIADFFAASEIGKRDVLLNGKQCVEYYSYKDGLAVKTLCMK